MGPECLARSPAVESGVRFVTLTFGGWDMHSSIERSVRNVLPILDRAVGTLVDDLHQRGMLDNTAVVVMGEFGAPLGSTKRECRVPTRYLAGTTGETS